MAKMSPDDKKRLKARRDAQKVRVLNHVEEAALCAAYDWYYEDDANRKPAADVVIKYRDSADYQDASSPIAYVRLRYVSTSVCKMFDKLFKTEKRRIVVSTLDVRSYSYRLGAVTVYPAEPVRHMLAFLGYATGKYLRGYSQKYVDDHDIRRRKW